MVSNVESHCHPASLLLDLDFIFCHSANWYLKLIRDIKIGKTKNLQKIMPNPPVSTIIHFTRSTLNENQQIK